MLNNKKIDPKLAKSIEEDMAEIDAKPEATPEVTPAPVETHKVKSGPCTACNGTGLQDSATLCPVCSGTPA